MTASLKVRRPDSMDPETAIAWCKNTARGYAEQCDKARSYYERMQKHYTNITDLLARLLELKDQPAGWEEEARDIVETLVEVGEAMEALSQEQFDSKATPLKDEEAAILATEPGREAASQLDREAKAFKEAYNRHKARLGLKTQDDVAKLTGINRRHISSIERGRHKPQFRTLKRLADAFGIDVTVLMGE